MRQVVLAGAFGFAALVSAAPPQQAASSPASAAAGRALLDKYCITCHNQRAKTAGLMFDQMDLSHLASGADAKETEIWERAVRKLRGGMMPPPGMPRPDNAALDSFVTWLETSLDQAAAANPNPGSVPLHRLNRAEYTNAIKDLLAMDFDSTAYLPTDDVSNGFDNIANVLKVSPSFLDQYISAARAVSKQAVGAPPPAEPVRAVIRPTGNTEDPVPLGTRGSLVEYLFPADGEYEFRMGGTGGGGRGGAGRGGAPTGADAGTILTLDGLRIPTTGRVAVKAGVHKIGISTIAHSFVESDATLQSFIPGQAGPAYGGAGGRGGGGGGQVQITGPYNPAGASIETASRQRIFVCRSTSEADEATCAGKIFANLERRAFRRPVSDKDLAAPLAFFKEGRATGDFEAGIQSGLIAILASPKFLYRAEIPPQDAKPGTIYKIPDLDLASRLSFFLWSSIPDEELLRIAEQGKLNNPAVFDHQVRRMLASAQSKSLVTNFAFEWLRVREIATLDPDMIVYPNFDANLRTAFRREMELFVDSVIHEDRSALDLLTANYTFLNERLAMHYGIPDVRGDYFRRVTLPDSKRWGLLGKGAILMVTAYPNRTSPVLRGAFILENITGTPPSPPPPNVEAFKENKDGEKAHTVREIMELHRANPSCNACHGVMDPLGFALENFDTIGAWRAKDRFAGTMIDSSGKLVDGSSVNGPDDLRQALMKRPAEFVQTMTEKVMTYALGRSLEAYDMPAVRKIVHDAAHDNYRFSSIVIGIVNSAPFQLRKISETPTAATQVAATHP